MPDDAIESISGYTALGCNHQSFAYLGHAVTALMFDCSGTQIYDPDIIDEGSGQPWELRQRWYDRRIEPIVLVLAH